MIENYSKEEMENLISEMTHYFMVHQVLKENNIVFLNSLPTKEERIIEMNNLRNNYKKDFENLSKKEQVTESNRIRKEYYERRKKI